MRFYAKDFAEHGFIEDCQGCRELIRRSGHNRSEICRARMEIAILQSRLGQDRKRKADDRLNEHISMKIQKAIEDEDMQTTQLDASTNRMNQGDDAINTASSAPKALHPFPPPLRTGGVVAQRDDVDSGGAASSGDPNLRHIGFAA
jgi:hypothetical protein